MWLMCVVYAWLKGDFIHDYKIGTSLLGSKATKPQLPFSELFIILYFG